MEDGAAATVAPVGEPDIEAGRLLFAGACRFVYAAQRLDQLPPSARRRWRSPGGPMSGKSSLMNALTGHHALARASGQPGRTRQLNFFDLGGRLMLVDMPGYGYAQAPQGRSRRTGRG